jgi:BNR/Asp-box repeat
MSTRGMAVLSATLGIVTLAIAAPASAKPPQAPPSPSVVGNYLIDADHNAAFPQNKQNEQAITRDPLTGALIAGANDEISQPLCSGTTQPLASPCPFAPGAPTSGYYRSTDGGKTWAGGYLPGFNTVGRTSGGDPTLDWGPARCTNGTFSTGCGVEIYYGSLADPFGDKVGGEQVTVSRSSDDGLSWSNPVQATSTDNKSNFDDHPWLAVDHFPGSPHYGRLYVFWAVFCFSCAGNGNVKLYVAHSDDEGRTWAPAVQVSAGNSNSAQGFRETGQLAVSRNGTVEAFWTENADSTNYPSLQVAAVSTDGGKTFSAPVTIAQVTDYPLTGTPFDVVDLFNRVPGMSARVDCYPHPASDPTSNRVYVVWCDDSGGHGVVKGALSSDGFHWTSLGTIASINGSNAFFPAAAVSPTTGTVSLTFDALTAPPLDDPWQTGVQTYRNYYTQSSAGGTSFSAPLVASTAASNPDGSSYNDLQEQFLGDYIDIIDGPDTAYLAWTDSRAAKPCGAVDTYRNEVYAGQKPVAPNPDSACSTSFGNTDSEAGVVNMG